MGYWVQELKTNSACCLNVKGEGNEKAVGRMKHSRALELDRLSDLGLLRSSAEDTLRGEQHGSSKKDGHSDEEYKW